MNLEQQQGGDLDGDQKLDWRFKEESFSMMLDQRNKHRVSSKMFSPARNLRLT